MATQGITLSNSSITLGTGGQRKTVFKDFSLNLEPGQITVLLGPSGVGKSTLLRWIAGLLPAATGGVSVPSQCQGFVFQEPRLFPWLTVRHNIKMGLYGLGLTRQQQKNRVDEVLSLVGLTTEAARWPHQLSGGQKQRVSLARGLVRRPDLLLMDEPFSALDPQTRTTLQRSLIAIQEETATTILFVTHDTEEAVRLAHRIIMLAGSPAAITKDLEIHLPHPRSGAHPDFRKDLQTIRAEFDALAGYVI